MGEELIYKLVDFLETASPMVWGAVFQQIAVQARSRIMWGFVCFIIAVVLAKCAVWNWKQERGHYDDYLIFGTMACCAGIASLIGIALFNEAAMMIQNPTYYAIKNLIDLVPGS